MKKLITAVIATTICANTLGGCTATINDTNSESLTKKSVARIEELVAKSENSNETATPKQEFSLNRFNQVYGVGKPGPGNGDYPRLTENWYLEIPATNETRLPAYPLVNHQDKTFFEMQNVEQAKLEEALADVQEQTSVGPWLIDGDNATGCGPYDKRTTTGRNIGAAVGYFYVANVETTDEEFREVVKILEEHYPGLTAENNIFREYDDTERRTWNMASDRDDFIAISRIVGHNRIVLTFQSACFVTLDNIEPPASNR